jgi:hypothetical protein
MTRRDHFRYGSVNDVVMRRLESGASPPAKRNIEGIANWRLPIADFKEQIDRTKSAIGSWQLAMTR